MAKAIACVNLKGGVGKTALAVNLAAYAGRAGLRTLLIDLDPQTNATFWAMSYEAWKEHAASKGSIADLLGARRHRAAEGGLKTVTDVLVKDVYLNVDLVPSHLDLFTIDLDMGGETARETKLRRAVSAVSEAYDLIVMDCPPNLTIPTQNALALSSHFVIPVSLDHLSAIGVGLLINRVKTFCEDIEHSTTPTGIVFSKIGRPAHHRDEIATTLRTQFGALVLAQGLTERSAVSEAAGRQMPVIDCADGDAVGEFRAVSKELLTRIGL